MAHMSSGVHDRKIRYECEENDNHFLIVMEDGQAGELQVGNPIGREGRTVIGFKDLRAGLALAGYEVVRFE